MTVHLNRPMRGLSYMCTDLSGREVGVLYQNGNFHAFDESEDTVPVEWQKAKDYVSLYADWWKDEYDHFRYERDEDMLEFEEEEEDDSRI